MAANIIEVLAFLVVLYVLYRWVRPMIAKMTRDRQEQIQQQVDASVEATRKLQDAQRRFEHAEAEARQEVAKIRDDARADATRISEELREQADREMERIRQRGQEQLVAQRDQLTRGLRAELGAQSMELAERIVREALADDRRKSATADAFLADLEGMTPRPGTASASDAPESEAPESDAPASDAPAPSGGNR